MATNAPSDDLLKILRVRVGLDADDTSQDAAITAAYIGALSWLEAYLDRYLEPGTYTEVFTHIAANVISLKGYPVATINTIEDDDADPVHYHVEKKNGLIHFDGFAVAHELTVNYDAVPVIDGALMLALLGLFDVVWGAFNSSSNDESLGGGAIKAITSDGARVEFDVSGGGSAGFGAVDPNSGMPVAVAAMLHVYKRWNV